MKKISRLVPFFKDHKKLSLLLAAIFVLTVFRLVSGQASPGPFSGANGAVYVELGQATLGNMRELALYYGTLTAPNRFELAPKVGGELKELLVNIGDRLESGQLVASLDDQEFILARDRFKLNVQLAEAQKDEARANLELAKNDMNRQSSLAQKRIVSQSDYEAAENRLLQAEARYNVAASQLQSAQNQLADAELKLSWTKITATWADDSATKDSSFRYVGARLADTGQLVAANTPLLELVSLDPLLVVVEVMEKDYPKIVAGQTTILTTEAFPGQKFSAKVLRVAPVLSADSRQARVELEVDNHDLNLRPGMFAELTFVFSEHPNVWSVAQDVPFRRLEGYVIFLADPKTGTVSQKEVKLGLVEDGRVELVDFGPIEYPVVVLGQHLLKDGQAYKVPGASIEKQRSSS